MTTTTATTAPVLKRGDAARTVPTERYRLGRTDRVATLPLEASPAPSSVNAGLTKCPGCACNVVARSHRPGSEECRADRVERLISIAD